MYVPALLFIFGLIVGSFLNVLSFRYTPENGFWKAANQPRRSRCPHCQKKLSFAELIPVISFFIQKGQCRSCGAKLSWQYPLVELASGLTFLLPIYFQSMVNGQWSVVTSVVWISVFLIFILIWTIDFRLFLIPNELVLLLLVLGIALTAVTAAGGGFGEFEGSFIGNFAALFGLRGNIWLNHLAAAAVGALVIGLIILITRGRGMGMGDLKLAVPLGLLFGWPDILFLLIFSFLIGGAAGIWLLATGRRGRKDAVPFGPFLVLGSLTVFFFGKMILESYFNFFGFK